MMRRAVLLLVVAILVGCFAFHSPQCDAIGIGARVQCNSPTGAFIGDTSFADPLDFLAGLVL